MSKKATNSQTISKLFSSRKIILDLAKKRGYDVEDYENFTINEIQILKENKQLDMLLEKVEEGETKKIYYKYHLVNKLRGPHVQDYIEDLYQIEEILSFDDNLVIVTKDEPNPTLKNLLRMEFTQNKYYVNVYNYHNYLYNVLNNDLVPDHTIISDERKKELAQEYNIISESQWPEISRFDPTALAIGLRPGQVAEINRKSPTALETKYYRLCVSGGLK
jgi:DNA-directed RNA polymerase subunit H|tara:strand:- start:696 stop:1352 length:657 start_codon:yes stop_codon:yes gene_type:complete